MHKTSMFFSKIKLYSYTYECMYICLYNIPYRYIYNILSVSMYMKFVWIHKALKNLNQTIQNVFWRIECEVWRNMSILFECATKNMYYFEMS